MVSIPVRDVTEKCVVFKVFCFGGIFFTVRYNNMHCFSLSKLLGITIQHEKPQLEVQKTELLRKEEELKVQLAELEESLLEVCTTVK